MSTINSPRRVLRAMFGKLGGGLLDYGMQIWNPAGQVMWRFDSGVTTPGITPGNVTTVTVAAHAIHSRSR